MKNHSITTAAVAAIMLISATSWAYPVGLIGEVSFSLQINNTTDRNFILRVLPQESKERGDEESHILKRIPAKQTTSVHSTFLSFDEVYPGEMIPALTSGELYVQDPAANITEKIGEVTIVTNNLGDTFISVVSKISDGKGSEHLEISRDDAASMKKIAFILAIKLYEENGKLKATFDLGGVSH